MGVDREKSERPDATVTPESAPVAEPGAALFGSSRRSVEGVRPATAGAKPERQAPLAGSLHSIRGDADRPQLAAAVMRGDTAGRVQRSAFAGPTVATGALTKVRPAERPTLVSRDPSTPLIQRMIVSFHPGGADDFVTPMTDVKEKEQLEKKRKDQPPGEKPIGDSFSERPMLPFKHERNKNPFGKKAASPVVDIEGGAADLLRTDTLEARRVAPNEDLVVVAHGLSAGPWATQAGMEPAEMAKFVMQFLPLGNKAAYSGTLDFAGCLTAHKPALRKMCFTEEVLGIVQHNGWTNAKAVGYRGIVHPGEYGSEPLEFHSLVAYKIAKAELEKVKETIDADKTTTHEEKREAFLQHVKALSKYVTIGLTPVPFS